MDASSGLDRDQQHEDPEWHAAVQLVGLCAPVTDSAAAAIQLVRLSIPVAASPNSDAAAAAPEVSNKNGADRSGKEKEFKKPDTVLSCPRCNSMRTKFCYFNNYNPNQPRHYCSDCKRYWTDGGILRDVPVGSARRRNRNKTFGANEDVAGTSRCRSRVVKPLAIPGPAEESGAATTSRSEMVLAKSLCPWLGSGGTTSSPPVPAYSGSDSLALGKHPREEEEEVEKTFWVPKALRVTDPEEAAKSTIWASLGIKLDERILHLKDGNVKTPESPATYSISCYLAFQKRTREAYILV